VSVIFAVIVLSLVITGSKHFSNNAKIAIHPWLLQQTSGAALLFIKSEKARENFHLLNYQKILTTGLDEALCY
jgi:hypothetical protein